MSRLRHAARTTSRHLWHTVAVLLIMLAVAITLLRLLLPTAQEYRETVAEWVGARLGQPVIVEALDARLVNFSPVLVLKGVSLLHPDGGGPAARFREALIAFDLIGSIRRGVPMVRRLTAVGVELTIERGADGRLAVHGLELPEGASAFGDVRNSGGNWLLAQGELAIREGHLRWVDRLLNLPPVDLHPVDIQLRNQGSHHGFEAVASGGRERLRVVGELSGNPFSEAWGGRIYLETRGLDAGRWARGLGVGGARIADGTVAARLWTDWRGGRLVAAEGEASLFGLQLRQGVRAVDFERLAARGRFSRDGEAWRLALEDLRVRRHGHSRPSSRLQVSGGDGLRLLVDELHLEDAAELLSVITVDEGTVKALVGTQPKGRLQRMRLERRADDDWHAQAVVKEYRSLPWETLPGVDDFSGRLAWNGQQGELQIDSHRFGITLPRLFPQRLDLGRVAGRARVTRDGGWRIEAHDLRVVSDDIELVTDLELRLPPDGSPHLDLAGTFWNGRAVAVAYFLPTRIMNAEATRWLGDAFHSGTITSGKIDFSGALADFPFDHGEGRFEIRFRAHGVELHYKDGWPNFLGADAEILFQGRRMEIDASVAHLFDGRVERARVGIPDLQRPWLTISGEARTPAGDLLRLLGETPLKERFSPYLYDGLALDGDALLRLEMEIPLVDAVKDDHPLAISGNVVFDRTKLRLTDQVVIEQVVGRLDFTEQGVASPGLSGRFAGGPLTATVATRHDAGDAFTRIQAKGQADSRAVAGLFDPTLAQRLAGALALTADVTVPTGARGVALSLQADLTETASGLPSPLNKPTGEPLVATFRHVLSGERRGETRIALGDRLNAAWKAGANGVDRAHLHFGQGTANLPGQSLIQITGSLDGFAPDAWAALNSNRASARAGSPLRVRVDMERLGVARAADGEKVADRQPALTTANGEVARRLGALEVDIEQFAYGAGALGSLRLRAERRDGALHYTDLQLAGDHYSLGGVGKTTFGAAAARTDWELKLASSDVGKTLETFGFASAVKRGTAAIDSRLGWPGGPGDYTLAAVDGELTLSMRDGAFDEVEPGAGKMIGLFSLDAIPRRLRLDFRDLTEEGLAFHEVAGTLNLRDGSAYTADLHVDAPAAKMVITGRTGIVARDYDNLVTVVPNVSDTLPVAGGLVLGPQVAAALLILRQIFKDRIDSSAAYQYQVTGSWESPQLERVAVEPLSGQP